MRKISASSGSTTNSATTPSRCGARAGLSSRFFATVGNYDYGFYWYLYQDGTIQLEVKLTGIIQTAAIAPGEKSTHWGGMVADGLGGADASALLQRPPAHGSRRRRQHRHRARVRARAVRAATTRYGNVFDTTTRVLSRERDAARDADGRTGRFWKIINPNETNSGRHADRLQADRPSRAR